MACKQCKARGDAHFGWCVSAGGPGYHPSRKPKAVIAEEIRELARRAQHPSVVQRPSLRLVPSQSAIQPGVNIIATRTPQENAERLRRNELLWTAVAGDVDWSKFDLDRTAHELFLSCQRGLPKAISFGYSPDVLALAGFDVDQVETAVRAPQRVEIRPESGKKGYPILGFHRGDVTAILGMRTPTKPLIIAAYWTSLLAHDEYRRPERTGGGGARKTGGLPTTALALVKRLREAGAEIDDGWQTATTVTVTYHGQELGKINVAPTTPKAQVQQDWQRAQRKIQAIDRREAAAS